MPVNESEETKERHREDDAKGESVVDQSGSETTGIGNHSGEPQKQGDKSEQNDRETDRDPPNNGDGGDSDPNRENRGTPPAPSDDELHLLMFLWLLERNDTMFELSGF